MLFVALSTVQNLTEAIESQEGRIELFLKLPQLVEILSGVL